MYKKTGDYVEIGDVIAVLHTNREDVLEETKKNYLDSIEFTEEKQEKPKLIYELDD